MIYNHFTVNVTIRIILLVILAFALAYVLTNTNWFFTPIVITMLIIGWVWALIHYLDKTNRDLSSFLTAIKQGAFTGMVHDEGRGGTFKKLSNAYNEILDVFQKITIDKESQYQYLQTVNENIGVALLSFKDDGTLEMMNPAAKTLFNKPLIRKLEDLESIDRELFDTVKQMESGERKLLKVVLGGELSHIAVYAKYFVMQEKHFRLFLFQNINNELEEKEVEAWQKLISVLTHEIMNSVTPIVSLVTAVNQLLQTEKEAKGALPELNHEEVEDIYSSLRIIENRSKGLLQFINAYKEFSKVPELNIVEFDLGTMLNRIEMLLRPDFAMESVKLEILLAQKTLKVKADQELIEQVLINLVKNAKEALKGIDGGRIQLSAKRIDHKRVLVRVSDNGPGINQEVIDKIFVPFFTTKKSGTGVGLSLSRQILKLHGGKINVQSSPGAGCTFSIEF